MMRDGTAEPVSRATKFSRANGDKGKIRLTTSRIGGQTLYPAESVMEASAVQRMRYGVPIHQYVVLLPTVGSIIIITNSNICSTEGSGLLPYS